MLIRCQRCQALFSLQDNVAGAAGSFEVECGRCGNVFAAEAQARLPTPLPQSPATPAPRDATPGALERPATVDELAQALKPRRPGDEAAKKPAAMPRRRIWLFALAALALAGGYETVARFTGPRREARVRIEAAQRKLLRDDAKSLEAATVLFTEAARLSPGSARPEAQRAFALLLQSATHKDLAARLEAPIKDLTDRAAQAPDDQKAKLAEEAARLSQERDQHARDATRRAQEGLAAAKAALEDDHDEPIALRSLALHQALEGTPEKGQGALEEAARRAPGDAWVAWTRAALLLAGPPSRDSQDRALAALAVARQAEPRMLRAQVEVAAISLDRQEPGPARIGLTQVLQENPQHERAQRLLSLLPAAP